jgi:hypothetical protein
MRRYMIDVAGLYINTSRKISILMVLSELLVKVRK